MLGSFSPYSPFSNTGAIGKDGTPLGQGGSKSVDFNQNMGGFRGTNEYLTNKNNMLQSLFNFKDSSRKPFKYSSIVNPTVTKDSNQ